MFGRYLPTWLVGAKWKDNVIIYMMKCNTFIESCHLMAPRELQYSHLVSSTFPCIYVVCRMLVGV
jgi:hypothetical protein